MTTLNYGNLCKTIAQIIILNRRRPAEVASAELHYWINRPKNEDLTIDELVQLTEDEKQSLCELSVIGKLLRTVPILLTRKMVM